MDSLIATYFSRFDAFWKNSSVHQDADKAIIFVERRPHKYLEFVIKNFHYYLPDWSIEIHGSPANEPFVKEICGPHSDHIKFVLASQDDCECEQARTQ